MSFSGGITETLAGASESEVSMEASVALVEIGCSPAAEEVPTTVVKDEADDRSSDIASLGQKAKITMQRSINFIIMVSCCCRCQNQDQG